MPKKTDPKQPGARGPKGVFSVDLKGPRITVGRLLSTTAEAMTLLREVDKAVTVKPRPVLEWVISNLGMGSVHLEASPELTDPSVEHDTARRVLNAVRDGLRELERGPRRPRYFSERAMESAVNLTRALDDEGVHTLNVRANGEDVRITPALAANVDKLLTAEVESLGSIEGRLETVTVHGTPYFNIYDALTGRRVRCYFPNDLLDDVRRAFARRVLVFGEVWVSPTGDPQSIRAREIRIFPEEHELPPAETVRGILRND